MRGNQSSSKEESLGYAYTLDYALLVPEDARSVGQRVFETAERRAASAWRGG